MTSYADDRARFDRQILRHRTALMGLALKLTRSPIEAEDLVQEAVLRAWSHWHRFQPGTNGRAWAQRILVNAFINRYRRRKRERRALGQIADQQAPGLTDRPITVQWPGHSLSDEVSSALAKLPDAYREVLVLVDVDDHSYREAARHIGCPVGTVMSRLHRARQAMKDELRGYARTEGYAPTAVAA